MQATSDQVLRCLTAPEFVSDPVTVRQRIGQNGPLFRNGAGEPGRSYPGGRHTLGGACLLLF